MTRMRFGVALSVMLLVPSISTAQQQMPWQQTLNTPKGLNMPGGVKADILGIELGDSFAEAKTKLEKLAAEGLLKPPAKRTFEQQLTDETQGVRRKQPYREEQAIFRLQQRGSQSVVAASFVKQIIVEREFKGSTDRIIGENIRVVFSAPSSGHQVLGIERSIFYHAPGDQPRVNELIAQLSAKFKSEAKRDGGIVRIQFNDGKPEPYSRLNINCRAYHATNQAREVPQINPKGDCDVVLEMSFNGGISPDHASFVKFVLSDNERTKANLTADFKFIQDYIRKMQDQTRGETPKL